MVKDFVTQRSQEQAEAHEAKFADTGVGTSVQQDNIVASFINEQSRYIADRICPPVPVTDWKGTWNQWTIAARDDDLRRAQGARGHREDDRVVHTNEFQCFEYMAEEPVDDQEAVSFGATGMTKAVQAATQRVLVAKERDVATLVNTAGNYPSALKATLSGTDQWSDAASDPIGDINTAKEAISDQIMVSGEELTLIIGDNVLRVLQAHGQLLARDGRTQLSVLENQDLARVLGLKEIIVGGARYDTTLRGQTRTTVSIWDNAAILANIEPVTGEDTRTLCFSPTIMFGSSAIQSFSYQETPYLNVVGLRERRAEVFAVQQSDSDADTKSGYHWTNAIA